MNIKEVTHHQLIEFLGVKSHFTDHEIKYELKIRHDIATKKHNQLFKAANKVISWTEVAHRPPVADELEFVLMVNVRLHALAEIYKKLQ